MDGKNLHEKIIKLLDDPSFIRYVKGTSQQKDRDWEEWIQSNPEEKVYANEAVEFINKVYTLENVDEQRTKALWSRIEKSTSSSSSAGLSKKLVRRLIPLAVAACLGLFLIFKMNNKIHVNTGYAQNEKIELPDLSSVILNADSELSYSKDGFAKSRVINLKGEAYFEVSRGNKFTVVTEYGDVSVLGTSFNIFARDDKFKVQCKTGSVKVKYKDQEVILKKGEESQYNEDVLGLYASMIKEDKTQWINGRFVYTNERLYEVLKELERQFNKKVIASDEISQMEYSGFFQNNDLNKALQSVLWPMHLDYKIDNDKIIVESRKK